jgi:hypothetical protein
MPTAVLRIRKVYLGSRFVSIPDPGYDTTKKWKGKKNCLSFFVAIKIKKNFFFKIFGKCKEKHFDK